MLDKNITLNAIRDASLRENPLFSRKRTTGFSKYTRIIESIIEGSSELNVSLRI